MYSCVQLLGGFAPRPQTPIIGSRYRARHSPQMLNPNSAYAGNDYLKRNRARRCNYYCSRGACSRARISMGRYQLCRSTVLNAISYLATLRCNIANLISNLMHRKVAEAPKLGGRLSVLRVTLHSSYKGGVGNNVPINALQVILETSLSSQSLALVLTT